MVGNLSDLEMFASGSLVTLFGLIIIIASHNFSTYPVLSHSVQFAFNILISNVSGLEAVLVASSKGAIRCC